MLSFERLAALKPITQRVGFMTDRGEQQNEWTGPLLWDVLAASGATDAIKPGEHVRLAVRVTGADGYTAMLLSRKSLRSLPAGQFNSPTT